MKKLIFIIAIVAIGVGFMGCPNNNDEPKTYKLGDLVNLKYGQSISFNDDGVTVSFSKVINDDRLPMSICYLFYGRTYAKIEISFSDNNEICNIPFSIEGCVTGDEPMNYKDTIGYRINVYRLDPYPNGNPIDSKEYKIKIKVQKL